jgi:hypothetical protein
MKPASQMAHQLGMASLKADLAALKISKQSRHGGLFGPFAQQDQGFATGKAQIPVERFKIGISHKAEAVAVTEWWRHPA